MTFANSPKVQAKREARRRPTRIYLSGGPYNGTTQKFDKGAPPVVAIPQVTDAEGNVIAIEDYVEGESNSVIHFYKKFTRTTYRYAGTYLGKDKE